VTRTGSALPIRSALDGLRLEFPEYRISQQVIGDRLFYVAEAADPLVRPVFAQAQTVDRLRAKLRIPEVEVNAAVPTIARVYDFLLGGKDNFEADRAQARNVLEVYPQAAELVIQARQFQARAVAYAAQQGIGQFLISAAGCRPRRTPTRPPRPLPRTPGSSTSTTMPRSSRTPGTCWPTTPACWPVPGIWPGPRRFFMTGGSGSSWTSTSRCAWSWP
jgi:S-adenosyl methyltransferase